MSCEPSDRFDEIADAIQQEYKLAQQRTRVPPAEIVWMRAALRAREEAARKALYPIVIAQAVGIAACAGLLISLVSRLSLAETPEIPVALIELVVGSWIVLAPVALYLAFSRE